VLRNLTLLPAAWRLSGLENLGEDFSVSQSEGTVEPCAELSVYLYFKATKALSIKKTIRLEVRGCRCPGWSRTRQLRVSGMEVVLEGLPARGAEG